MGQPIQDWNTLGVFLESVPPALASPLDDCGGVIGAAGATLTCSITSGSSASADSGFVSLVPYRTLYIHSNSIGSSLAHGPQGQTDIVAKLQLGDTMPGQAVIHHPSTNSESFSMPPSLSQLGFSLRDSQGRVCDLQGHSMSFTIVILTPGQ